MSTYTLATDIGPDDSPIALTTAYSLTGSYPGRVVCESEVMYVTGGNGTNLVSVLRGCDGTDRASHSIGTAFADANIPTSSGGGGVTVTDGTTSVTANTISQPPGTVAEVSAGIAQIQPAIVSDSDPGAIGAGNFWLQTGINSNFVCLHCRNASDTDWINVTAIFNAGANLATEFWDTPGGETEITLATSVGFSVATDVGIVLRTYGGTVHRLDINTTGIKVTGLPQTDPLVAGYLWVDPAAGFVLKVSQG